MATEPTSTARHGAERALAPPSSLWSGLLGEDERARLAHGRFARRSGFGSRPAVVVIDAQNYMLGPIGDEPYEYVSSCGEVGRAAARQIARLLDAAREAAAPVFYTRFELARDGSDMGAYRRKRDLIESEGWCLEGSFGAAICRRRGAQGRRHRVRSRRSRRGSSARRCSASHRPWRRHGHRGRRLDQQLRARHRGRRRLAELPCVVPADCVFDRVDVSHRVALFDLDRQYGDVCGPTR